MAVQTLGMPEKFSKKSSILNTYNIVPSTDRESHTITNETLLCVQSDIRRGIITLCIPEGNEVKFQTGIGYFSAYIASVPSPVREVGNRTSKHHKYLSNAQKKSKDNGPLISKWVILSAIYDCEGIIMCSSIYFMPKSFYSQA